MTLQTIDMRFMRYLNLFEKVTRLRTKTCFSYNNTLFYAVPLSFISRAIGQNGENIRQISSIVQKRVKIVVLPKDEKDLRKFISEIISPVTFKDLKVENDDVIITGNMQSRASLIGRDKVRLEELSKIVKDFFGKNLKIM
jgi:transcription antitermination factor NusA-like protein